jgi:gamma-glutamyltranspeptidase/glutathione hydrolase
MFAGKQNPSEYQLVGVPGTVAGLALAHERFGKLPWREVVMPAVRLAKEGFTVQRALADSLNGALRGSSESAEFVRVYSKDGKGGPWRAGERMVLDELGATLSRIAERGAEGFYKGTTADLLVAEMKRGGGLIREGDLHNYRARIRQPIHGTFRGYHIYGPPPPSSGGTALVEMFNILENFELHREERYSATTLHLLVETMRRVYRDRARYLGDSDFVEIPGHLVTKEYAKKLAAEIDWKHATDSLTLAGDIELANESPQTTHFSVVDGNGMAVANTYTLEESFGSRIVVRGAGFLLNNEMGDFNPEPGVTDTKGKIGTKANLVAPGKRMLSSMTPVVVTTADGRPLLVTGSPGGRTIINTVACVVLNVLEFKMSPADAVAGPRLHHAWFPDRIQAEPALLRDHRETIEQLKRMGHTIHPTGIQQGDAHTIWIDPKTGIMHGAPDGRRAGAALGL